MNEDKIITEKAKKDYFRRNNCLKTAKGVIYFPIVLILWYIIARTPILNQVWMDIVCLIIIGIFLAGIFTFFTWHQEIDLDEKRRELEEEFQRNLLEIDNLKEIIATTDDFCKEISDAPQTLKELKQRNEQIKVELQVIDM